MLERVWIKGNARTVSGNVNWYSHSGGQYGDSLKKKKRNETTIWPNSPTPRHVYLEETKIEKDTCVPLFTAALFTIARSMEATEMCINKWMDQEVHIHNGILLSHKWIKSFFGWRSAMTQFRNELVCCQSGGRTVLSQFGSGETS